MSGPSSVEGASAALDGRAARERMRAAREVVDASGARRGRAHIRRQHGLRAVRLAGDPRGAGRGAPAPAAAQPCVRRRRAVSAGDRPRGDAAARERAREGLLRCACRARRAAVECLDRGVLPRVPSRGSVGASGDLAPLAHLALPLVGEGEAWVEGELLPGARRARARRARADRAAARRRASRSSTARSSWRRSARSGSCARARLAKAADIACALSVEALQGSRTSFLPQIHALRPLRGQQASAANVLRLLEGSAIIEAHRWCDKVQDAYSLRCAPQVHGAARDLLDYVEYVVAVELNAATDNPLVLVEDEPPRLERELPRAAASRSRSTRSRWPSPSSRASPSGASSGWSIRTSRTGCRAFLTVDGGLNSGFMIPQYVAASLVSENKVLAHPASVDSIPTSAGQEDHVSMGNAAGLKAWQVLANAERVLAIELLAGAQAVEFLAPLEPGAGVAATRGFVRVTLAAARRRPVAAADIERSPARSATGRSSRRSRTRSERSRDSVGAVESLGRSALRRPARAFGLRGEPTSTRARGRRRRRSACS